MCIRDRYHIAPVRREVLSGLDVVVGIEGESTLLDRIRSGLKGELVGPRYGLPFAGENNLLFDRIDPMDDPIASLWYTPVDSHAEPRRGSCRLTVDIDRGDSSRTRSTLVAPLLGPQRMPPAEAWVWTPREPSTGRA